MKRLIAAALGLIWVGAAGDVQAQKGAPPPKPLAPPPPPPISYIQDKPQTTERFVYDQKLFASRPYLVTPEQAQSIISRFREAYGKMGSPRILIYVNRELVDQNAGLKLSARSEQTEIVRSTANREFEPSANNTNASRTSPTNTTQITGSVILGDLNTPQTELPGKGKSASEVEKVVAKNNYRVRDRQSAPLSDRQTVRDVERLFGRPLRLGGAKLTDQNVATQLITEGDLNKFAVPTEGLQAKKERQALRQAADVVIEVLVSSRSVQVSDLSGDKTVTIPDIQATAIRLSDSAIIGQATATDLIGQDRQAGRISRTFDVREITEATALSLMEDMLLH